MNSKELTVLRDGGVVGVVDDVIDGHHGVLAAGQQPAPLQDLHEVYQGHMLAEEHVHCWMRYGKAIKIIVVSACTLVYTYTYIFLMSEER